MVGAEVTEMIQGYVVSRQLETTETRFNEYSISTPNFIRDDA